MNLNLISRTLPLLALTACLIALHIRPASAQTVMDEIEVARSSIKTDRKVVIAEGMEFTAQESAAFWPLYREYRSEMEKVSAGLLKLVLEYADVYPDVPEDRASRMLKDYSSLETELADKRAWYLKKFSKVLPAAKTLRFAQLENRMDLVLRLQLASIVPLVPVKKAE